MTIRFCEEIVESEYNDQIPEKVLKFLNNTYMAIKNHPKWKSAPASEFENVREGLEKLVTYK